MDVRKMELKRLKRADKQAKRRYVTLWKTLALIFLIVALILTPISIAAKYLDNVVCARLGGAFWHFKQPDAAARFDTGVMPPLATAQQTYGQIQTEGIVLLENANNALPLQAGETVRCVAHDAEKAQAVQGALTDLGLPVASNATTVIAVLAESSSEEQAMLAQLAQKKTAGEIQKFIVLWDAPSVVQPSLWADCGVDGVLWTGGAEARHIAGRLYGASPDGSLPYTGVYAGGTAPNHGFYTGYFYHETRYEDYVLGSEGADEYLYGQYVAYPFGFGLGYSTFAYSDLQVVYDDRTDCFSITLTVTNTGEAIARETVQIYAQSPYTDYDKENCIEKPAVKLVGFFKTDLLEPGMAVQAGVQVPRRELSSFDATGAGAYVLEAGDYYFTAAADAHEAVNNILCAKGYSPENTENRMDSVGNKVLTYLWKESAFDDKIYGATVTNRLTDSVQGVSRKDWVGTLLQSHKAHGQNTPVYNPGDYPTVSMPTTGAKNGLTLSQLTGLAFDDPKWQTLLDQLTVQEMVRLIGDAYNGMLPVKSVQAPGISYVQAPETVSRLLLEATFQPQLAHNAGYYAAKDAAGQYLLQDMQDGGEDSLLSGQFLAAQAQGIADCGSHVVLQTNQLTFPNHEQTLREKTLRALQYTVETVQTTGVVTDELLLAEVLRDEWRGKGVVLTENQPVIPGVLAGVTAFTDLLPQNRELLAYQNDPVVVTAMRQACHYHLYTLANSEAMNGIGPDTVVKTHWLWSIIGCMAATGVCYVAGVIFTVQWGRGSRKWKQTETHQAYQALKTTLKSEQA